ncbi:hypothetical protein HJC23_013465 [Cyclotella cryptica]|uniref:Uncharacterized protein n=1 Tax=Cyclotella cryptica TaxID=29204 RepID=A0ABD3QB62_9STRA
MAYEGIVSSVWKDNQTGSFLYNVVRSSNALDDGIQEVFVETVIESDIAFGLKCPVFVKMMNPSNSDSSEVLGGEILCLDLTNHGNGNGTKSYTVKVLMKDGGIQIEREVSTDRIRYQFGLDQLQAGLRGACTQSSMIGIRKNLLGIPLMKRSTQTDGEKRVKNDDFSRTSCDKQHSSKNKNKNNICSLE